MTRKRYKKLGYALMQKLNQYHIETYGTPGENMGNVLKWASTVTFDRISPKFHSYEEAWESIKGIRQIVGM